MIDTTQPKSPCSRADDETNGMKSKHVQRGITNYTKRMPRKDIGRMTRLRKVEVENEEDENQPAKNRPNTLTFQDKLKYILVFALFLGLAGLTFVIVDSIRNAKKELAFVSEEKEVLQIQHPKTKEAIEIAKRFLEATELYQWNGLICDQPKDAERAFSKFAKMKQDGWKIDQMEHFGPRQVSIGFVNSILCKDNLGKTHWIDLIHHNAEWKIDAAAALQMHSKEWSEFFDEKSTHGIVRVLISDDSSYYNGRYNDESNWQSFKIIASQTEESITGYAKRNSACHVAILKMLQQSPLQNCILEIHRDVKAEKSQYEIEKVISSDWIISDQIYSDLYIDQSEKDSGISQGQ